MVTLISVVGVNEEELERSSFQNLLNEFSSKASELRIYEYFNNMVGLYYIDNVFYGWEVKENEKNSSLLDGTIYKFNSDVDLFKWCSSFCDDEYLDLIKLKVSELVKDFNMNKV